MHDAEEIKNLLNRAKNGDKEAFGTVYESYFTQIYRYIYFRVKNKELAEDLVQTVFIRIFVNLDSFNPKYPRAYFFTVAKNIITDHWRKKKDISFDETDGVFTNIMAEGDDPLEQVEKQEKQEKIHQALQTLPEDQKEALSLRFIHQFSNQEISEVMEKKEPAVRQLQSRGIKKLRQHFKTVAI